MTAVQLALETDGFTYWKWGAAQKCKSGDWIVNNNSDIYTVDRETFERTYREVTPGAFVKCTPVWAEAADGDGFINTKEGRTHYCAGDYLVSNAEDGSDAYAIAANKFEAMYELAE